MQREIDERLIRPEKLMGSRDLAKLGCGGCRDCSYCCENRACPIVLDPWDVREMKKGLGLSFEGLIGAGFLSLSVIDGVVLPVLCVSPGTDRCVFLSEEKRCRIHAFRPGICRLFPLARLWHEDGSFSYFLQEGECLKNNGAKIRIDRWLGIPGLKEYDAFLTAYHRELDGLKKRCLEAAVSDTERTALQTGFLEEHFLKE